MKKAIKKAASAAASAKKVKAAEKVKAAKANEKRGRPRKVVTVVAGASNGRPLTAAKIIKQQMRATQDARQMYNGLVAIANSAAANYDDPRAAYKAMKYIAKDSLKGVRL